MASCLDVTRHFLLNAKTAEPAHQIDTVPAAWTEVCADAALTRIDCTLLAERLFLNPVLFKGAPERLSIASVT